MKTTNKTPDYFAPLIGWRKWTVIDGRLNAVAVSAEWPPYEALKAVHAPNWGDNCRGDRCVNCGIYALKDADDLKHQIQNDGWISYVNEDESAVVGRVALWGRVHVHKNGYRAQFAYPVDLVYGKHCDARAVANTYGIPFVEDLSWTSVFRNEPSSLNPSSFPFPSATWSGFQYLGIPRYPPFPFPRPWTSPYILRPEEHQFIVKPPVIDPYDMDLPGLPKRMLAPKIELPTRYQLASGVWVQDDRIVTPEADDFQWVPMSYGVPFIAGIDWAE